MSHLSQNLERLIQMISIEQLLGLVKQNNTSADILTTPIVQKVVKAYEDELQTLNSVTNPNSCVKDYSEDIAKIHEQLASINSNLLHLADAIKNIHISTNLSKSANEAVTNSVANLEAEVVTNEVVVASSSKAEEEEHVRLKIEEKQVTTANDIDDSDGDESSVASLEEVEIEEVEIEEESEEEEEEESEKEISDEETESETEVADEEEEEEEEEEETEELADVEEEEEVFEIEIDDVTYYATSEENGILYEVDADGEVGKKVGIIKDGEPIFS